MDPERVGTADELRRALAELMATKSMSFRQLVSATGMRDVTVRSAVTPGAAGFFRQDTVEALVQALGGPVRPWTAAWERADRDQRGKAGRAPTVAELQYRLEEVTAQLKAVQRRLDQLEHRASVPRADREHPSWARSAAFGRLAASLPKPDFGSVVWVPRLPDPHAPLSHEPLVPSYWSAEVDELLAAIVDLMRPVSLPDLMVRLASVRLEVVSVMSTEDLKDKDNSVYPCKTVDAYLTTVRQLIADYFELVYAMEITSGDAGPIAPQAGVDRTRP
ncbi:hypothetical protein ACFVUH_23355 [Kitasatospora sp. NPDC058032]|uniref:hypothetical protein n=1 Tax=Kitasatospora sp. NPDC058032 TaxID=3346307 RepID=UPI0036D9E97D